MKKEAGGILSKGNQYKTDKYTFNEKKDNNPYLKNNKEYYLSQDNNYIMKENYYPSNSKSPNRPRLSQNQSQFVPINYEKIAGTSKKKIISNNYVSDSKHGIKSRDVSGDRTKTPTSTKNYLTNQGSKKNKSVISTNNINNNNSTMRTKNLEKNKNLINPIHSNHSKISNCEEFSYNDFYLQNSHVVSRSKSPAIRTQDSYVPSNLREQNLISSKFKNAVHNEHFLSKSHLNCKEHSDDFSINKPINYNHVDSESVFTNYRKIKKANENIFSQSAIKTDTNYNHLKENKNSHKMYSSPNTEESNSFMRSQFLSKNETEKNNKLKNNFQQSNNFSNKIYLEKKESFSLIKTMTNQYESDTNLLCSNKETTDSMKYKMTNTNSSGPTSAMHLEEVKALFEKLDPEEYHLLSINLIQSSKRVVRKHEDVNEKDNLFNTVTKCEERDL